jgi:hypothetical protein
MDLFGTVQGRGISYSDIFEYFNSVAEEQQDILGADLDTMTLLESFPRFPCLDTIQISFVDRIDSRFRWIINRMLLDGPPLFPNHLEKLATALLVAKESGVIICALEVYGLYSRAATEQEHLRTLVREALDGLEELRLTESPFMLSFMSSIALPRLRRVELSKCWLSVSTLE